jgi:hypothetical protein
VLQISGRLKKESRYDPREDLRKWREMRKMNLSGYLERIGELEKGFSVACRFLVTENLRVRDAILGAGGLTPDADRETGEIVRFKNYREYETLYFHLGKAMSGDPLENHPVFPKDRIVVHSIWEKMQRQHVYVEGEVSRPGIYVYTKGMKSAILSSRAAACWSRPTGKRRSCRRRRWRKGKSCSETQEDPLERPAGGEAGSRC